MKLLQPGKRQVNDKMASLGFGVGTGGGGVGGPPSPRAAQRSSCNVNSTDCRALVLGLSGVGKTALTVRLLTKRFIGEYCPTLESLYCYRETVENEEIRMEIFDTAGTMPEDTAPEAYIMWANSFLLVYAINDRRSFDEVARLKRRIDSVKDSPRVPTSPNSNTNGIAALPACILVGNKSDLECERRVRRYEGQRLARLIGCTHFFETSARDGDHVAHIADMFHTLHADFRRHLTATTDWQQNANNQNGGRSTSSVGNPAGGTPGAPSSSGGGRQNKFRHAIQKVMNRSKAPTSSSSSLSSTASANNKGPCSSNSSPSPLSSQSLSASSMMITPGNNNHCSHKSSMSTLGPACRESIV